MFHGFSTYVAFHQLHMLAARSRFVISHPVSVLVFQETYRKRDTESKRQTLSDVDHSMLHNLRNNTVQAFIAAAGQDLLLSSRRCACLCVLKISADKK